MTTYKKRHEQQEQFFKKNKDSLIFQTNPEYFAKFTPVFIQVCLLPRMLLEQGEAMYCAEFVINMFRIKALNINQILK